MTEAQLRQRSPLLWRTRLYSYRMTIGAIAIAALSIFVAWVIVYLLGLNLVRGVINQNWITDPVTSRIIETVYRRSSSRVLAIAGGTATLFTVAFTLVMSVRVSHAVTRVRQVAEQITDGDTSVRIEEPLSRLGFEFEDLSEVFNSMVAALNEIEATRARLLGDLAHEMRTPLATLDAYLEAIGDGFEEADEETIDLLRHQTARLARLAADISLVAKVEEGQVELHRQPLRVVQLVKEACQSAVAQCDECLINLTWQAEPGTEHIRVSGDPDRLGQVLTNLLTNARRHTPPGGRVKVTLSQPEPGWIDIAVRDNGEGIAAEHLAHLFERFYRVDSARDRGHGGSGIGLTIVKAMTAAHGGHVAVASDGPGKGATFTVTLPVME